MKKTDLRQQAEAKLSKRKKSPATDKDPLRLIHELEVHQIELEMQNEELVQTRAEAEAVHRQYTDLYDFAPVGYFTLARDGTIQMSNLTGVSLLGAERNKLVKRRFGVFVSVESRPVFNAFLEKIFTTGKNEACEITLLKEGHKSCWVHLDAVCSEDRLECRVVMKDITERKLAEEKLRESEGLFKQFMLNSPGLVYLKDDKLRLLKISKSLADLLGKPESELIGRDSYELVPPEFAESAIADDMKVIKEGVVLERDEILNGRNFSTTKFPIHGESEKSTHIAGFSIDITERKRAETELKESERRLRETNLDLKRAESEAHIGNWKWNLKTAAVEWSDEMFRIFGIERDSYTGRLGDVISKVIHPDDLHIVLPSNASAFASNQPQEYRIIRPPDGAVRYIWARAGETIFDEQGNPLFLTGLAQDITERKQAESELFASQTLYRLLAENSSDVISMIDAEGKVVYISPAFARQRGYEVNELLNIDTPAILQQIHPDDRERIGAEINRAPELALPASSYEYRTKTKQGGYIWVEDVLRRKFDENGNFVSTIVNSRDITQRKRAEEALRESEEQLLMSQQIGRAGSWGYNLETDKIWGSLEGLRIYGLPLVPDDYPIAEIEACIPERERVHQALLDLINEGRKYDLEFIINPADGSAPKVVNSKARLEKDANGKPLKVLGFLQDITERKQAEDALQKSKQLLEKTMSSLLDAVFIIDADTVEIMDCNPAASAIFGYSRQEMLGQTTAFLHVSQASLEEFSQHLHSDMEAAKDFMFLPEYKMKRKDGTVFFSEHSVVPLKSKQGQRIGWVSVVRDITESKQAEEALRVSEERYRLLANNVPDIIYSLDGAGNIVTVNSPAFERYGYTEQDAKGKPFLDFIHPEDRGIVIGSFLKALEEQRRFTHGLQFRIVAENGVNYWFELNSQARFDSQGGYAGEDGVLRDITERKQIEDTLMFLLQGGYQDEDFFHSLARHLTGSLSMDYVCIDRLAGDQLSAQTLAIYFDGKFDDNVSYTLKDTPCGDAVGKSVCVFPSQVRHLFPLDVVLQEMPAESYVGSTLWNSQGKPIGLIAVIGRKPLSPANQRMAESILKLVAVRAAGELERQQAEEEIRQLNSNLEQRVEERTRELSDAQEQLVRREKLSVMGELAGSVGHELRNPLSVITSAVYYLKMIQPDATDKIKQYLGMIEQEVWNSEKIINNLLDFGRTIFADPMPVSVSKLIDQTLERFPVPASVSATLEIPEDLPQVYVDPHQVTQVFNNLIVNACQAITATSLGGGKLTISTTLQDGMLGVGIHDTGIGIPPENMIKIFEPLFTTKAKGVGLGLALSRKLIEANGGKIIVESLVGKGSTFTVFFPIAAGTENAD